MIAWILPFVVLASAGFFVKKFLQDRVTEENTSKQNNGQTTHRKSKKADSDKLDNEDEEKVKQEMKKYL